MGKKEKSPARQALSRLLPPLGQRIVKTAVAVFLCLLYYWLRGYRGMNMNTEAGITAIICMQPYLHDTRDFALSRLTGTLIGSFWGLLLLLVLLTVPDLENHLFPVYTMMGLGVLASLYTAVLLRRADASGLAAIVFLCIVIAFPEIDQPLRQAGDRIFGVLLGTGVAIGVNTFRLPRSSAGPLLPDPLRGPLPAQLSQPGRGQDLPHVRARAGLLHPADEPDRVQRSAGGHGRRRDL